MDIAWINFKCEIFHFRLNKKIGINRKGRLRMNQRIRKIFGIFLLISYVLPTFSQNEIKDILLAQGAWFLFSTKTEEHFDDDKTLTQIDFFKKADVSSIFFDQNDKLYSVFSKEESSVWEDLWRQVDDTHFVIVSPVDSSHQVMDILELSPKMLVIRNCSEIEDGNRCLTYTYFATKDGWLSDKEVDELNSAGVIDINELVDLSKKED